MKTVLIFLALFSTSAIAESGYDNGGDFTPRSYWTYTFPEFPQIDEQVQAIVDGSYRIGYCTLLPTTRGCSAFAISEETTALFMAAMVEEVAQEIPASDAVDITAEAWEFGYMKGVHDAVVGARDYPIESAN